MTDKEKLEKLMKLADAMYYAAQNLTTDASRLHKAMDEYHKFIIYEYHKEEPTIPDIVDEHFDEMLNEESVSEDFETALEKKVREAQNWTYIEEEGGECPLNEEFGADDLEEFARWGAEWVRNNEKEPVSEDLEEAVNAYIGYAPEVDESSSTYGKRQAFKAGANWQEQKDESYTKSMYKVGINTGKELMKQQLMTKAVDAVVKVDAGGYPYVDRTIELYDYDKDIPLAKNGDKYKVILIKE